MCLSDFGIGVINTSECVLVVCDFRWFDTFLLSYQFLGIALSIVFIYYPFKVYVMTNDDPNFISNIDNSSLFSFFLD